MKRFGISLSYVVITHVMALVAFFVFRLSVFLLASYTFPEDIGLLTQSVSFVKGLWFDNVIACYVTLPPLLVVVVANMFKTVKRWVFTSCAVITGVLYSVCFIVAGANIPYFNYFFNNINSSIFNWFGYGATTGGMIFQESSYYFPILLTVMMIVLYWVIALKLAGKFQAKAVVFTPPAL